MKNNQIKKPFALIIFGASGDLAKLKLFPAIYQLAEQNKLPKDFYIIGYARTEKSHKKFQQEFETSIKKARKTSRKTLNSLLKKVYYFSGQYNKLKDYKNFREYLKSVTKTNRITKVAYFSVPPVAFKDIIENLGKTKTSKNEDLRLIIEKPFGQDGKSARELFHFVARYFSEDNVYLLDHYLGKSAVQSILHLRHSNRLLNLMMKGPEIANIQINALESIGVTSRSGYFEQVGTIKDMMQSHLLQILALVTMSIPITENAESLHREKYSILSALQFPKSANNIVLGQYETYKKEKNVPKSSKTETFSGIRLFIDRESWYKVPIYIRTGKKLHKKHTYIVVELKKFAFQPKNEEPNRLIIELQPEEKINVKLVNKHESGSHYQDITTSDSIACKGKNCLTEHGLLLLDTLNKNKINFLSFPEILASWNLIDNIEKFISGKKLKPEIYKNNSKGPEAQKKLPKIDNFTWYEI